MSAAPGRIHPSDGAQIKRDPNTGLWYRREMQQGRFVGLKRSGDGGSFYGVKREN